MEDLANDSAARVVDTPSGSLMYLEQKKQEQEVAADAFWEG